MNDVFFRQGVKLPYYAYELETNLQFYSGQAVVFLELTDQFDEYFNDKFWDDIARDAAANDDGVPDFSFDKDPFKEEVVEEPLEIAN